MKNLHYRSRILWIIFLFLMALGIFSPAGADPTPDVKINNSDGPVTVTTGTTVDVSIGMTSGTAAGSTADWFLVHQDPAGNFSSYNAYGSWGTGISAVYQGPLADIPQVTLYSGTLSAGDHYYYFAVDQTPDLTLNLPVEYDVAQVTVQPQLSGSPISGEYGDAPDGGDTGYAGIFTQTGNFPTLYASNGGRTLSVADAVLGTAASLETGATDTGDPDGIANLAPENTDSDDAISDFVLALTSIPPPAALSILVNGPDSGAGGDFYLNVLIDLDMDGSWGGTAGGGEPEWVVQNHAVTVTAGSQTVETPPAFAFANGTILPDGAWMRIALTKEAIAETDWNGSGEFSSGEIEDHVITLPEINGKKHPILTVACGGPYTFNANKDPIAVNCTVTNWRRDAGGTFDWTVKEISGDGVAIAPAAGGPVAVAAAPGPGNAVVVAMVATRVAGDLPSTWKFTAVPDPAAVVTAGGVTLGHGESAVEIEFSESASQDAYYVSSLDGSFQHFTGYSEVYAQVQIGASDTSLLSGAAVTVELLLNGSSLETQTVDIDPSGNADVTFTIYQYGSYTIQVTDVLGNAAYDSSQNAVSSADVIVN